MKKIRAWFRDEEKRNIIYALISGIALLLSLFGWFKDFLPFDLSWIAIFLCGIPIILGAINGLIIHHDIKADVLVALALIASVWIKEYFAAGEVAFIMAIGSLLENGTARKARQGIEKLINLTPKTARVKRDGKESIVMADELIIGDILIVLAGETIAADGVITSGNTSVDQSIMTGESIPVDKVTGDQVISGTLNQFGTFEMMATKVGKDSSLQRMIQLAEEADANKAPIVSLTDKWATWMVFAALCISVLCFIITGELIRAVTVLVVFCPCAFILATPTAIMAGIGNAAKSGILIRSGDALERFSKIKYIAFDKTGTLTYGKPIVIGIKSISTTISEEELLKSAALAEQRSEHPLGKAILDYYCEKGGVLEEIIEFSLVAGQGIRALVDKKNVLVGKETLFQNENITIPKEALSLAQEYLNKGATVIYVSINGEITGLIAVADTIRKDAKITITKIENLGIKPILLTGDNKAAAEHIAAQVGINDVKSDLLPEDKMKIIKSYGNSNKNVCMIGDGINDALALSTAFAGIAMGGIGSDIAVEASDAVLVQDDIHRIPYLIKIASRTMKKVKINIIFSMGLNLLAVILATTGILNPVIGAFVHNFGSVAVVINSALLLTVKEN